MPENNMSDSENHNGTSISTDEVTSMNHETHISENSVKDDEQSEALTEDEGQIENDMDFGREPDHDDQLEDDAQSYSYYPESLVDDEEEIKSFKQKIIALGTELHVDFEDIGYIREHDAIRAFPLTMRNPPEGATWPDGTRAVLRINGWWALNDRTSRGSQSEDDDEPSVDEPAASEASDNTEEAAVLTPTEAGNGESRDANEPQSPISTTSNSSASSNLSGSTLLNDYYDSDSDSNDDDDEDGDQWQRLDEALLSNLLEDHGVPAPQTLAFDVGWQNALKRPYSIQTYLPGDQVSKVHRERNEMSLEDRLWLAGEAAEIRARLETLSFEARTDINEKLDISAFLIEPYNKDLDDDSAWDRFGARGRIYYSLYDTMFRAVDDLMAKAMVKLHASLECSFRAYAAIKDILLDMDHLGWFSEADRAYSRSVLNHGSINDTQILVERTGDIARPWRLTGIIGFYEAEILPSVLTRQPWSFLWDVYDASKKLPEETRFSWTGDVDELPTELPYLNAEDLKVKQHYEDVLIEKLYTPQYGEKAREKYFDDTYGRGRWLRRLFVFAREGVPFRDTQHRFNKLLRDWNHFKKSQNIQPRPLNLWEGLPDYIHAKHILQPQPVKPPTPPSSLRHVYFFIDPVPSSSQGEVAATEVTDDSS
ncbi:hypothetical protein KCU65_g1742, partial [Aureobasidium melanogenum]